MINKKILITVRWPLLLFMILYIVQVNAASNEYIRDYSYHAEEFDTRYTSRIRAIDGVKQSLIEELGTYVQSIVKLSENDKGNKSASHDMVMLTAGVISTKILAEDWDREIYYVKASMMADKEEVLRAVEALRNDYRLEEALRESMQELDQARHTIRQLQIEMHEKHDEKELMQLNNDYVNAARDLEVEYQYQRALKAIIEGSFDEAFNLLKDLADKDYANAQSKLGHMYERGMGVEVNYHEAANWYLKSIGNGSSTAYARLGYIYERGLGVKQDYDRAAALYAQSSELGSPHGKSRLGRLYLIGKGVHKDTSKALQLFKDSVDGYKHGRGYAMLGYMYEKGIEVEQSYQQAAKWYDKAALRGNPFGMSRMAWLHVKGRGVDKDYSKALALSEHAVKYNNPFGLAVMGYLYEKGHGVYKDHDAALELYMKGAAQKSGFAMFRLGNMYQKGSGVADDIDEAIKWYRRAADLGHSASLKRLSKLEKQY